STPGLRKPSPKDPVQRRQAWSFGTTAQHEQLVSQGQNLQEQVPAGVQPGNRQVKRECQPTNHVAEDLWKHRRSPVFSARMRFLPVTGAMRRTELTTAVRTGGDLAQRVLLRAGAGERGEPGFDAAVGRVASETSGVWEPALDGGVAAGRLGGQSQASGATAAVRS